MLRQQFDDEISGDIKSLIKYENSQGNSNLFGLGNASYIYGNKIYEPFRFRDLSFFVDAFDGEPGIEIEFEQKYRFKPQYIAKKYYGTPRYGYLIMYFNRILTISDFRQEVIGTKIKIPSYSTLEKISNIIDKRDLEEKRYIEIVDATLRKV